jgi:hypothetical protein
MISCFSIMNLAIGFQLSLPATSAPCGCSNFSNDLSMTSRSWRAAAGLHRSRPDTWTATCKRLTPVPTTTRIREICATGTQTTASLIRWLGRCLTALHRTKFCAHHSRYRDSLSWIAGTSPHAKVNCSNSANHSVIAGITSTRPCADRCDA